MTLRMAPSPLSPRCFWRAVCALAFAALAILPAALAQAQPTGTEAQVRAAFDTFKQSLTQRDGDTAIRYIDDGTAAMHERYRQLALKAPKDTLLKERLSVIVGALTVRQYLNKAETEALDGRSLFGKLISIGGGSGTDSFKTITLGRVVPARDGRTATGELGAPGSSDKVSVKFFTDAQGNWRIGMSEVFEMAATQIEAHIGVTPRTPPDVREHVVTTLVFPALATMSGKPVNAEIWTLLQEKK